MGFRVRASKETIVLLLSGGLVIALFIVVVSRLSSKRDKTIDASYEVLAKKRESTFGLPEQLGAEFTSKNRTEWFANGPAVDDSLIAVSKSEKIELLKLHHTEITSRGFAAIVGQPIQELRVSHQNIDCDGYAAISKLLNLRILVLKYVKADDEKLKCLKGPQNLEGLIIKGSKLSTAGVKSLVEAFPELRGLTITHDKDLVDSAVPHMLPLKKLRLIDLSYTGITDNALPYLSKTRITQLDISGTAVTDNGIKALKAVPVSILHLEQTNITDNALRTICDIKTVKTLFIRKCPNLTPRGVEQFRSKRPDVHIVYENIRHARNAYRGFDDLLKEEIEKEGLDD